MSAALRREFHPNNSSVMNIINLSPLDGTRFIQTLQHTWVWLTCRLRDSEASDRLLRNSFVLSRDNVKFVVIIVSRVLPKTWNISSMCRYFLTLYHSLIKSSVSLMSMTGMLQKSRHNTLADINFVKYRIVGNATDYARPDGHCVSAWLLTGCNLTLHLPLPHKPTRNEKCQVGIKQQRTALDNPHDEDDDDDKLGIIPIV